jgi:Tfp pilus assembly protein PilF
MEIRTWRLIVSHGAILAIGLVGGYLIPRLTREYRLIEARGQIQRQIRADPADAANWASLGVIDSELSDKEAARTSFEKALSLDPANYESLIGIGNMYMGEKDYGSAKQWYTKMVKTAQIHKDSDYACEGQMFLKEIDWNLAHKSTE